MAEIMKNKGGNDYKLPHLPKDHCLNEGMLEMFLYCDAQLVVSTKALIGEGK